MKLFQAAFKRHNYGLAGLRSLLKRYLRFWAPKRLAFWFWKTLTSTDKLSKPSSRRANKLNASRVL